MRQAIRAGTFLVLNWFILDSSSMSTRAQTAADLKTQEGDEHPKAGQELKMTRAVACLSIDGYEQYEVLPKASLTSDEKLLVYYRPLNYKITNQGAEYLVHFTQDGQIRRAGEKTVLRRKKNFLDYEAKTREPPGPVFLRNSVSLKGLPPGEYEFDVILRDENSKVPAVTQSLKFRVIPAVQPKEAGK
jgi:hypothetical protein